MAYTSGLAVVVGAATKASDMNASYTNEDYLQTLATVGHDFDVSTGTGYHRATYNSATRFYNGSNYMDLFLDFTDTTHPLIRVKFGVGSVPVPASATDGFVIPLSVTGAQAAPTI